MTETITRTAGMAVRETYVSRFWTVPANRSPIARRMAKAGA